MTPAVKVQILDPAGALSTSTTEVALELYDRPPNSGELTGTVSVAAVSGTATFSNLLISRPGAGYTLQASATELPYTQWMISDAFNVTSAANLSGTKTVAGNFDVGGTVTYTIVLTNSGPASQINNPGREFTDVLPAGLTLVSVTATSGFPSTNAATRTAGWNGTLAKDGSVTITITATINNDQAGQTITNQAAIAYDADGDGTNEASAVTDDPNIAGSGNPTVFQVNQPPPPPTPTPTATATPTPTATATPTITPAPTASPSASPNPSATASPSPSASPTPSPSPMPAKALNISTRLRIDTGDNVMIGGFIITGTETKRVIIRALGPSLRASGADNAVADPVLELRGPAGELIFVNDNWRDAQEAAIEESTVAPGDDLEAAIIATLDPGAYTAVVIGKGETSGVGLVEAYDLNQGSAAQLANISTRGLVLTDTNVLIGGFILGGTDNGTRVIVRALGPSLAAAGVSNTLANPTLDLRDANGERLFFNDNWQDDDAQAAGLTELGIAPANDAESAIVATLPPGSYTAIVAGSDGGTGVGLVEVYNVP